MALLTWNGTNYDNQIGSASLGGTNVNLSTTGVTSLGSTAPNTTNFATGVWIAIASTTNSPNTIRVDLLESGVIKRTAYINQADHVIGFNYVRFAIPYQFTTTAAGAYTVKLSTSSTNSGSVRAVTAGNLWYQITYDSAVAVGASDDVMVGGFNDSGLTAKTMTVTGTGNSWGSGTNPSWTATTQWDMASPLIIGSGGNVVFDTTANTTLTVAGSVVVYKGGVFDMRPGSAYTNTLIFNQGGGDGRFGLISPTSGLGGQILTTGKVVTVGLQYASGDGSTGSPLTFATAHGLSVGDELYIPGLTYGGNQIRFVKTIVNTTQVTTSATSGGAESAFTNTPAVGSWISNTTRNSIIKSTATTVGHFLYNSNTNATPLSDFKWTRHEYANCASGRGLNFNGGSTATTDANDADFTGTVFYNNSAAGRNTATWSGKAVQTVTDLVIINPKGTNFSAQSGLVFQSYNKTANRVYAYSEPSSTTSAGAVSFSTTSVSNRLNNFHAYGLNASNGSLGYALGLYGVFNTVTNSTINSTRVAGVRANSAQSTTITNSSLGTIGTNTIDLVLDSSTLNTILWSNCNFGSGTLISGYTSGLEGTDIRFHKYQQTAHKHRWYTNRGWAQATGSGLEDTTVRTAGSYNIKINPESASGFVWEFTVKSIVDQIAFLKAYLRKNSTMGTDDAKVELFMPGTDLTGTADAIYNATDDVNTWQDFVIGKAYSGSENTEAVVRVTATSTTAGAAVYMADFFDGQEALNSWFEAKPTKVIAPTDFSGVAGLVWNYLSSNSTAGTYGRSVNDIEQLVDEIKAKIEQL